MGAGPVYSLEMAKALAGNGNKWHLQVIINENVINLSAWKEAFQNKDVDLQVVKAYKHSKQSVFLQFFNYKRKHHVLSLIKGFNPDVLYVPFGLMWSRYIFSFLPKQIKIVSTIHDVTPHDHFNFAEEVSKLLSRGADRYVNGYVILNNKDKAIVEERYHKPVIVIPHASFSYYFRGTVQSSGITRTIGFFGRIEPYKGLDILVDALEKTKTEGLHLLIAGGGMIEDELQANIERNNNITLINRYIKEEEFQPLLDKCDFVVLPYKRASQSGVIPMCFAYGKTVIATNVGALAEQVPKGTGVITYPNAGSIANEIDKFYAEPELIVKYGKSAREYADKELTWEHSAELLMSFVETINEKR